MTKSDSIKNLATALCAFQASVEAITKDSTNPFFKSKYASLSAIIEDTRDLLAKNGLSYAQFPSLVTNADGTRSFAGLTTILMHTSGEWIESGFPVNAVDEKPQSVGSAITYARRYALQSILGLQVEDDDGNAASQPKPQQMPAKQASTSTKTVSIKEAKPAVVKEGELKKKIFDLCNKLSDVPLVEKSDYEEFVVKATGLDLKAENYETIIERLSA